MGLHLSPKKYSLSPEFKRFLNPISDLNNLNNFSKEGFDLIAISPDMRFVVIGSSERSKLGFCVFNINPVWEPGSNIIEDFW